MAQPARTIRVDLNIYAPEMTPLGIGEPNKVATELAAEWTAQRPECKVKFQLVPDTGAGTSEGEWLKTQLIGGIAPEITHMNAEAAWPDVGKGWFVPLDEYIAKPNPYVEGNEHWLDLFTNQALVGAKRASDGKLYCVPLDIVETGVFYNKTLLAEIGIDQMPETWAGMIDMLDEQISFDIRISIFNEELKATGATYDRDGLTITASESE
jgi:ABC-type glycerol-3-phosphate transport system substrate-binding protein